MKVQKYFVGALWKKKIILKCRNAEKLTRRDSKRKAFWPRKLRDSIAGEKEQGVVLPNCNRQKIEGPHE